MDRMFMQRCLELAARGKRYVSPNPMVGCVIVKNGVIVGEGYHRRFGGAHAEVRALREAGRKAYGATVYVNLEPCSHHGKTPPCVDALLKAGVKRVVTGSKDPNPLVSGKGLAKLRKERVQVDVGVLRSEAEGLNERFFAFMQTGMPFVGTKIAQTLDGYIADAYGRSKWITAEPARREARSLRTEYDAILVGANTVITDDPELTSHTARGRNPVRVVLDGQLQAPVSAKVFDCAVARTIVLASQRSLRMKRAKASRLVGRGVRVLGLEAGPMLDVHAVLRTLGALGISSVLVEGGSATLSRFLKMKLAHRIHCFIAPKILGGGLPPVQLAPPLRLGRGIVVERMTWRRLGAEILVEGSLRFR